VTFLTHLTYMTTSDLIPHIEALIFASDKPLTTLEILELVNSSPELEDEKISLDKVGSALDGITEKYSADFYPFEVKQIGGGWQFLTRKEFHKTVGQLNGDKYLKRLSAASLETLAIIAYKQPVTKGEIESIRGVSCDYAVQKLLEKELIVISGRNEKAPGQPLLYSTSRNFMDYFGINSAEELPQIKEFIPNQGTEPTDFKNPLFRDNVKDDSETPEALSVTETGELIINKDSGEENLT